MPTLRLILPAFALFAIAAAPAFAQTPASPPPAEATRPQTVSGEASAPVGEWHIHPVKEPGGKVAYCAAESRFANGLVIGVLRNRAGETSVAISVPQANLTPETVYAMRIRLDTGYDKAFEAVTANPTTIIVRAGIDDPLFAGLRRGNRLTLESKSERAAFQLKGTSKALAELARCAAEAEGPATPAPAANAAPGDSRSGNAGLPQPLLAILEKAGVNVALMAVIDVAKLPPQQRLGDFLWKTDNVLGGLTEARMKPDVNFAVLTAEHVEASRASCTGSFTSRMSDPATVSGVRMRTADIRCTDPSGERIAAVLYYMTSNGLFTVFFHQAAADATGRATEIRDGIARVVRELAVQQKPSQ